MKAARELGYRPSLMARGLRTKLSQTIGLISDVVATEPYAGELIRGSMYTAVHHKQLMLIGESGGDSKVEDQLIHDMLDRGVDGFIYAAMWTRAIVPSRTLRSHPLVLLNCVAKTRGIPSVVPDEHGAGVTSAKALLEAGHSGAIYVVGECPEHVLGAQERIKGIKATLSAAGLQLGGQVECLWWPEDSYAAVSAFLGAGGRPTALICLNDRVAFGAYQAMSDAGLRIPDDVSVVSFDDSDLASWLRPQLTSIAIPHFDLGRRAVELLMEGPAATRVERLAMPIRSRGSIGPPPYR